jgi:hypothetical protein
VFMKIVIAQREAKTRLTIPTRRQVWPITSVGRLWPGPELTVLRMGVEGRRPSRRRVFMITSREESSKATTAIGRWLLAIRHELRAAGHPYNLRTYLIRTY